MTDAKERMRNIESELEDLNDEESGRRKEIVQKDLQYGNQITGGDSWQVRALASYESVRATFPDLDRQRRELISEYNKLYEEKD